MFAPDFLKQVRRSFEQWQESLLEPSLAKFPAARSAVQRDGRIPAQIVYSPLDFNGNRTPSECLPGEYPFTRGLEPEDHRNRPWQVDRPSGGGLPYEANRRLHQLHRNHRFGDDGTFVVSPTFDLPTLSAHDSDDARAGGEVGRTGVAVDSATDMAELLADFPLERTFINLANPGPAAVLVAFCIVATERANAELDSLKGSVENDPLTAFAVNGQPLLPLQDSLRLTGDLVEYGVKHLPNFRVLGVSGHNVRQVGGDIVQELTMSLANALAYLELCGQRGITVDQCAPRIMFFFGCGTDLIWEIAKLRAARRIWAHYLRERYGARDAQSWKLRCHVRTLGAHSLEVPPETEVIRTAIQVLAGVLGSAEAVLALPTAGAFGLSPDRCAALAVRTQQILAYEFEISGTTDPLGGAYAVEAATDSICGAVEAGLERIAAVGGGPMLAGVMHEIHNGAFGEALARSRHRVQEALVQQQRVVVGANPNASNGDPFTHKRPPWEPGVERAQKERLAERRRQRSGERVEHCLKHLDRAAASSEGLMPLVIEAARSEATLGEIMGVLREGFAAG